jgi:predicted dehydrogenase
MTGKRLRIGVVGLGNVAIPHVEVYRTLTSVEVVAGADVRPERLERVSAAYGFTPYVDYADMLARERLDIACVLTPAATHRAVTETAARHGVNVLCEKPMATSLEDANAMIAVCEAHRVKFFYGSSYRFLPTLSKARELIQSGAIGDVVLLTESMVGGQGPERYDDLVHHYPVGGPGGSGWGLVDHGIHLADSFAWLMNSDIRSVFGRGAVSGGPPVTEYLIMKFRNGAVGQLTYNWATFSTGLPSEGVFSGSPAWEDWEVPAGPGLWAAGGWVDHPVCIHVHGTRGALRIYYYANHLFLLTDRGSQQIRIDEPAIPVHFARQMQSFADSLTYDLDPATSGRDGVNALRAVLAAYESCDQQRVVAIGGE